MRLFRMYVTALLLCCVAIVTFQCTEKYPSIEDHAAMESGSCVYCHTNSSLLEKVATPLDEPSGEAGEG